VEPPFTEDIVIQIFRPADGYSLRVWADGRITQSKGAEPERDLQPYDPTLQYAEVRTRFVKAQRTHWADALSSPVTPGPHGPVGRVPNIGEVSRQALVFRAWQDGQMVTAELEADLRVPETLGPLQAAYASLHRWVFAPNR